MPLPIRARSLLSTAALALVLVALTAAAAPQRPARPKAAHAAPGRPAPRRSVAAMPAPAASRPLPPIVLVAARLADAGTPAFALGSRLFVRESEGTIRELLPKDTLFEVGTPSVSFDGRRIAFSARARPADPSHIWLVNADGTGLVEVTRLDPLSYSGTQPSWIAPHHLVFARYRRAVRGAGRSSSPTELFIVRDDGGTPERLTAERLATANPALDPATGRLVYVREVQFKKQIVSMTPGLDDVRLAAGPADRTLGSVEQPAPFDDGRLAATLLGGRGESVAIFGAQGDAGHGGLPRAIGAPQILAGPRAFMPAILPDGRILFCCDTTRHGVDTRLCVMDADGTHRKQVLDLPGKQVLDAKPLVATMPHVTVSDSALDAPRAAGDSTFAYHALNVFAGGIMDAPLPAPLLLADNLRARLFSVFETFRGGDSTVLLRDLPVRADGSVRVDSLPVDVPLITELVAADGRVLFTAHGFGRTSWVNAGSPHTLRCVGCHAGHSALPVPPDDEATRWFNAARSARVTASSSAAGSAGLAAAVDGKTRGPAREVAWISASPADQWLRLSWWRPLEVREVVLHGLRPGSDARITVGACEVVLRLKGTELSRRLVNVPLDPEGTNVGVGLTMADEVEIRFLRVSGLALGRRGAALAEVEAIARVP